MYKHTAPGVEIVKGASAIAFHATISTCFMFSWLIAACFTFDIFHARKGGEACCILALIISRTYTVHILYHSRSLWTFSPCTHTHDHTCLCLYFSLHEFYLSRFSPHIFVCADGKHTVERDFWFPLTMMMMMMEWAYTRHIYLSVNTLAHTDTVEVKILPLLSSLFKYTHIYTHYKSCYDWRHWDVEGEEYSRRLIFFPYSCATVSRLISVLRWKKTKKKRKNTESNNKYKRFIMKKYFAVLILYFAWEDSRKRDRRNSFSLSV